MKYWPNCGAQLQDGDRFCETCGVDVTRGISSTQSPTVPPSANNADAQCGTRPATPMQGQSQLQGYAYPQRLRDNRNVDAVTALTVITLGFYGNWSTAKVAEDADISCAGNGVSDVAGAFETPICPSLRIPR